MRTFIRAFLFIGLTAAFTAVCGCGGKGNIGTNCVLGTAMTVFPTSATVNHAATPPANQVQFEGIGYYTAPPGCAAPDLAWLVYGTWSNPEPQDITISSADDLTNGTAVCLAPTNGAVTLTGTFPAGGPGLQTQTTTQSVQLTCE